VFTETGPGPRGGYSLWAAVAIQLAGAGVDSKGLLYVTDWLQWAAIASSRNQAADGKMGSVHPVAAGLATPPPAPPLSTVSDQHLVREMRKSLGLCYINFTRRCGPKLRRGNPRDLRALGLQIPWRGRGWANVYALSREKCCGGYSLERFTQVSDPICRTDTCTFSQGLLRRLNGIAAHKGQVNTVPVDGRW
jgi:hypothetical protein